MKQAEATIINQSKSKNLVKEKRDQQRNEVRKENIEKVFANKRQQISSSELTKSKNKATTTSSFTLEVSQKVYKI